MKYFFYSYADTLGGSHRSMHALAAELVKKGNDVTIITPGKPPATFVEKFQDFKLIQLTNLDFRKSQSGNYFLLGLLSRIIKLFIIFLGTFKVNKVLKKCSPEVIYFNDTLGVISFAHRLISRKYVGVLYIRSSKKPRFLGLAANLVEKICFVSEDLIDVFSKSQRISHRHKFNVVNTGFALAPPILCKSVRNGFTDINNHSLYLPTNRQKVLLLGSYDPRKGHIDAIKMLSIIPVERRPLLVFAGPRSTGQSYITRLKSSINELKLEDDIIFLDSIENISLIFNEVDLTILPSECEGLPRVLIESLSFGVKVVSYKVSGVNEIIISDDHGRIVPQGDLNELAKRVDELLCDQCEDHVSIYDKEKLINETRLRFSLENYVRNFENVVKQ